MPYEPVIGLEIHAELETHSKMFCACPLVDSTQAEPNIAVCPVCAGMPGVLPVTNRRAVEFALRVALALECEISTVSIFARKNYFYPDLPKGYQISQYEQPLARNGCLSIQSTKGVRHIRVRRVHMEEDAGKLTHINGNGEGYSLVDLNRAGVPLLEIVTEPDIRTPEEARLCATTLRSLLRYLRVNSGDMQKGVLRIEPNVSVRPVGNQSYGTRTEIKNLNSLRALERSLEYEIQRHVDLLHRGERVFQETRGWDDTQEITVLQRSKEGEDDYRYFPEPDLPPLVVDEAWLEEIRSELPELPDAKLRRFIEEYALSEYDAKVLTVEPTVADYFEQVHRANPEVNPKTITNWISGELFSLLNQANIEIEQSLVTPKKLAELIRLVAGGKINQNTAKSVLAQMFVDGKTAQEIVSQGSLEQISDETLVAELVQQVIDENPEPVASYLAGKQNIAQWLFGQVMRLAKGRANPQIVQIELMKHLKRLEKI